MAQPESEIRRLRDLMPASGRMWVQIERMNDRRTVITSPFPYPWVRDRPVRINFELWRQIPRPQRDLLLLRQVSWVTGIRWFEPNWLQGAAAAGAIATVLQATQGDAIGTVVAGGLTALAGSQIWQRNRSPEREVDADRAALRVAERRGYAEPEAAQHLLDAIATVSQLEGRSGLSYDEALRCQNLRAIARLDPFPPAAPVDGFSQEAFPQETFAQEAFAQEAFAQEAFSQEALSQEALSQEAFPQETFAQEALSQEALSQEAFPQDRLSQDGFPADLAPPAGFSSDGFSSDGFPPDSRSPTPDLTRASDSAGASHLDGPNFVPESVDEDDLWDAPARSPHR
jgi:hypothetical protein